MIRIASISRNSISVKRELVDYSRKKKRVDKVIAECKMALNSIKCHDVGNMLHTSPNFDNPVLKETQKKPGFEYLNLLMILNNFDEGKYKTTLMFQQDATKMFQMYRQLLANDEA
jgi:hypothetical protein